MKKRLVKFIMVIALMVLMTPVVVFLGVQYYSKKQIKDELESLGFDTGMLIRQSYGTFQGKGLYTIPFNYGGENAGYKISSIDWTAFREGQYFLMNDLPDSILTYSELKQLVETGEIYEEGEGKIYTFRHLKEYSFTHQGGKTERCYFIRVDGLRHTTFDLELVSAKLPQMTFDEWIEEIVKEYKGSKSSQFVSLNKIKILSDKIECSEIRIKHKKKDGDFVDSVVYFFWDESYVFGGSLSAEYLTEELVHEGVDVTIEDIEGVRKILNDARRTAPSGISLSWEPGN